MERFNVKEVLVLIPAFNEEKNIKKVIKELSKNLDFVDLLVINDCSTDNTLDVLISLNVPYLSLQFNLGYSSALQTGFKYAVDKKYKYVIQFDGDGQHIAIEAKKLFEAGKKGNYDVVIGSRFIEESDYKHPLTRRLGTALFRYLIKIITRKDIFDPTSGFQLLNQKVFYHLSRMNNFPHFPDANLIIEMLVNGYTIKEVPVKMRNRLEGISMHSGIINPVKYMIKVLYSIMIIFLDVFSRRFIRYFHIKKK